MNENRGWGRRQRVLSTDNIPEAMLGSSGERGANGGVCGLRRRGVTVGMAQED